MKRKTILYGIFALGGVFMAHDAITNSSGAPSGTSGSPASNGKTCAQAGCHGGPSVTTQSISISSDIPASGFQPNTDYTFTVQADAGTTGSNRIGFEASVEDASGHVGSLTAGNGNKKVGSYITHTSGGTSTSNNSKTWNFTWNSGSAASNTEVYVAVNFSNGNSNTSGDVIATNTLSLVKNGGIGMDEATADNFEISPNPASHWIELSGLQQATTLRIYNLQGKLMRQEEIIPGENLKLDISSLKKGHYIIAAEGSGMPAQTLLVE